MIDTESIIKTLSDEYGKSVEVECCVKERAVCFFSLGLKLKDVKLMKASLKTLSRYFRDEYETEDGEEFYYTVPDSF